MKTENLFKSIDSASKAGLNIAVFYSDRLSIDNNKNLKENIKFIKRLASQGVTDMSVGYYYGFTRLNYLIVYLTQEKLP